MGRYINNLYFTKTMKEIIIRQNPWWYKKFEENSIIRKKYLDQLISKLNEKEITIITGLRRVGKTTLLHQLINYLIQNDIESKKILFLTLDDINFSNKTIFEIIETYREINGIGFDEPFYLILDEITYLDNFEQQLKNLYDSYNIKVYVSSSIASDLNDKKAFLTGRIETIQIMPLSYEEFLKFKNLKIEKFDTTLNKKYFEEYLIKGGIPKYVLSDNINYLNELLNSIIYKDIIAKNKIKDEKTIIELIRLLCQRIGKPTSFNKLSKILNVSDTTIKKYIGLIEKTYLFYSIEKDSKSLNEKITSPKKFYIADLGIKHLISTNKEKGVDFENLVFLKIKKEKPAYYLENGIEIDFSFKDTLIEAKYETEMNDKQQVLFKKLKFKNKIIAKDYTFFLS